MAIEKAATQGATGDAERNRNTPGWKADRLKTLKAYSKGYRDQGKEVPEDIVAQIAELEND